jgi:hypothetical protein
MRFHMASSERASSESTRSASAYRPHGVVGESFIGKHMISERISLESVEEEAAPLVEVGRREIEDDGYKRLDVEDRRCLGMKSGGGRGNLTGDDQGTGIGVALFLLQARSFLASSFAALFSSKCSDTLLQGTTSSGGSIGAEVVWRRS